MKEISDDAMSQEAVSRPDKKMLPTIIIDTREQTPLHFSHLKAVAGTVYSGDYSVQGMEHLISIERKSIADLVQSVTTGRKRFERELHRLRGYRFKRLLVVGLEQDVIDGNYRSNAKPKSVMNTLRAFEARYDLPVVFSATEERASQLVEQWCYWFWREAMKDAGQIYINSLQV